ncbi:MAG TPA: hypothetical protein VFS00_11280 [Polyangiaceae bacterium]|nr:hypothetical protein [Polyangiaceae bacterium]
MASTQLNEFLTNMALDPAKLAAYISDPEGAMAAAGLGAGDRQALQSADQRAIHERVSGEAIDPSARAHKIIEVKYALSID